GAGSRRDGHRLGRQLCARRGACADRFGQGCGDDRAPLARYCRRHLRLHQPQPDHRDLVERLAMTAYAFRAMSRGDLPMIERWLVAPEVMRWWGEPDEQYELVCGDLDHPDMDQFIVELDGRPFAYIQCYRLSTWNLGFGEQPAEARGIDQFIGEPEMIGCGHGSKFIRQFVDELL